MIVWYKFHENPFSRSRELLSGIFVANRKSKKQKNKKKNICITYMHPHHRRLQKSTVAAKKIITLIIYILKLM